MASDWQDALDALIAKERWYLLPADIADSVYQAYVEAFSIGASAAIDEVAALLPDLELGINFHLTNPTTLTQLEEQAATLITQINDGTRYYIKRALVSGVEEGLSSPAIAKLIRDGTSVEDVIKQGGFLDDIVDRVKADLANLTPARVESIVNTEINRAETSGRVKQWGEMGLTQKQWATDMQPCDLCRANEALGFVAMDYLYDTVFGEGVADGPPGHPNTCHCHITFNEAELIGKAGELKVWDGS